MTKKWMFLLAALCVSAVVSLSCTPINPDPDDPKKDTTVIVDPVTASIPVTDNWIWDKRPAITYHVENPNSVAVKTVLNLHIYTDRKVDVLTVEDTVEVPAKTKKDFIVTSKEDMEPGFYRANCFVDGKVVRRFVFGLSPFEIVSAPDKQPDFDSFWEAGKNQLAAIEMNPQLTEITTKSNSKCKVYLVEFNSVPDGETGDPVVVRGYYLEPQDGEKHPVIMHFFGYDALTNPSAVSCPSGSGNYAEFYLSHRGQYINNRTADKREPDGKGDFVNPYGDWFAFNFGDKNGYYYRGAFLDCVQAVRFMATRETSDMTNLFAEGSSQGGALCYAVAALSDIPFTAIAPNVAFLGDYPDYFKIVSWPGDVAKNNKGSMTDEEMYAFLSYFDTKNLATRISCAVYATSGLQDGTCPPHTNTAPYNNLLSTDKEMHYYPEMQHAYPPTWNMDIMSFFKARMK